MTSEDRKQAAHHKAEWISARSHAIPNAKFCGRENFSKFSLRNPLRNSVRIARNLTRFTNDADARHSVWGPSCLAARLGAVGQHEFCRDFALFRTQNSAAAKNFSKISVRFGNPLRIARNITRRTMATLGTVFGDLHASRQGLASSGNAEFGAILASSCAIPNAKFCGREIF